MRTMAIPLMLATLTDRRDFDDDWLLERKLDGERCVAASDGGTVRLESRTGKDLTGTYPEISAALAAQRATGTSSSTARWSRSTASRPRSPGCSSGSGPGEPRPRAVAAYPVVYCVFDILELDGEDLTGRPLLERRARLAKAIRPRRRAAADRGVARRLRAAVRRRPAGPAGKGSSPSAPTRRTSRAARETG